MFSRWDVTSIYIGILANAICIRFRAIGRRASFAEQQAFLAHLLPFKGHTDVVHEAKMNRNQARDQLRVG